MQKHLYILTGGSRGMGLAIAEQLLDSNNILICISRNTQASLTVAAQGAGAHLKQWQHDLAQGATASEHLQQWLQQQGPNPFASATLINNAGVIPRIGPMSQADPHDLAHALRVGLEAPMQICAAFLRPLTAGASRARLSTSPQALAGVPWPRKRATALPKQAWTTSPAAWHWKRRSSPMAPKSARSHQA